MSWVQNTNNAALRHDGTTKDAAMSTVEMTPNTIWIVQCADRAHEIRLRILASPDGMSGWEVGIKPGTKANVYIAKVVYGVEASPVADSVHAVLSDAIPFTLTVQFVENTITGTISSSGVVDTAVSHTVVAEQYSFLGFRRWGVVSAIDQAYALSVTKCELLAQQATRAEVAAVVCGGRPFLSLDGESIFELPGRVADTQGPVSIMDWEGLGLVVGGGLASIINPVNATVTKWTATGHPTSTLPGAGTTAGSTTATIGCIHRGRVYLAGMPDRADILTYSKFDDHLGWDTGSVADGFARAGELPVGDTIECLATLPNGALFIGCRNSTKMLLGDPLLGAQELVTLDPEVGVSGQRSLARAATASGETLSVFHSGDGLFRLPLNGLPAPLMRDVLTDGVELAHDDLADYHITLIRDPERHTMNLYLTPRATGAARHLIYEERIGNYQPGAAGMMPAVFPNGAGPTCAFLWRGQIIHGSRDGYLLEYSDTATTDYDGTAITSKLPLNLLADSAPMDDTEIGWARVLLSDESANVTFTVYSGSTPEQALSSTARNRRYEATIGPYASPLLFKVRAAALVGEITSTGLWELEAVQVVTRSVPALIRRGQNSAIAPGSVCQPPTAAPVPDPDPTPGDGPGKSGTTPTAPTGTGPEVGDGPSVGGVGVAPPLYYEW